MSETTAPDGRSRSRGWFWIGLVALLLGAVVVTNVVLYRMAAADESVGIEPDAYRKAERWDEDLAAQAKSNRLAWKARVEARLAPDGTMSIAVTLSDPAGAPVVGADVDVEAFAIARADDRVHLHAKTDADGRALLQLARGRTGLWEMRVEARRGDERFLATLRATVPEGAAR
jgi:nitrogen fixation protein FixH